MKKIIIAVVVIALCVGAAFPTKMIIENSVAKSRVNKLDMTEYSSIPKNAIYFLNTGNSDAIVIKSGDHLAMIDAGEDSDNPRGFEELAFEGYEQRVESFIMSFADENGKVHLDFVLGTHAHSDHIGGFDTIIENENIDIDKAYLKIYRSQFIDDMEKEKWDNQEVYDQMVNALEKRNIPIISNISNDTFVFGDFRLTILNTSYEFGSRIVGENDNSLAVLAEINGKKILLSGDMDNYNGDEVEVAKQVGKLDILKVAHHSYSNSTEKEFLSITKPELAIVTNNSKNADKSTIRRITRLTDAPVIYSDDEQGICIDFDSSDYKIYIKSCIY